MSEVEAAKSHEVREGAVHPALLAGIPVGLTRVGGRVRAFVNKCPHLGMKLTRGKVEDGVITCPFHGSSFDICSGSDKAWVTGFMGLSLPGGLCGALRMGREPHGLIKLAASEANGTVFVNVG